jgi:hypothetical protein
VGWLEGGWRAGLAAILVLAWAAEVRAQEDPKMALDDIPMGLDPVPGFADPGAAQRHCPGDAVVWPDPATGYFHLPRSPRFAAARGGFACLNEALGAGYWDTNPFAGGPVRNRAFPIDPALRPDFGS